jgi:uncharacterized protein (TIGR03067 family)
MSRVLTLAVFVTLTTLPVRAEEPKAPAEQLRGTWLFDEAQLKKRTELPRVWESIVTVSGDSFALTKLMGAKNDLKGTLIFDPKNPRAVDLKVAELDLSDLLPDYKLPGGTLPAIYKFDGDRLTLCFASDSKRNRPTEFAASADAFLVTLVRAPKDFKEFPKEITITATRPDGKAAAGATATSFLHHSEDDKTDVKQEWRYHEPKKTDANGKVVFKTETLFGGRFIVRDEANQTIAFVPLSPAKVAGGSVNVTLVPEVRITGSLVCDELAKAKQPIGWTNVMLLANGAPVCEWMGKNGKFAFVAPAGKYSLHVYGSEIDAKYPDIVVPGERSEFVVEPIALSATAFALLKGKPVPELEGIIGWSGEKVKFADLKGKYVLVEFWGYWCGPCVHSMPVLIELHEKYADKGLAIVGVHVDLDGEVDTAAKLDAKIAHPKKELWKGKDLPFPSALASGERSGPEGKRGGPVAQYGIQHYPTTLLIDREGKLVGEFGARDIKKASEEIEKLLAKKK